MVNEYMFMNLVKKIHPLLILRFGKTVCVSGICTTHTLNGIISLVWACAVPILCTHAYETHHFNVAPTPL